MGKKPHAMSKRRKATASWARNTRTFVIGVKCVPGIDDDPLVPVIYDPVYS